MLDKFWNQFEFVNEHLYLFRNEVNENEEMRDRNLFSKFPLQWFIPYDYVTIQ